MTNADPPNASEADDESMSHENVRKLRAAARLAQLGYWEDDLPGDRLTWTEDAARILGLPAHERSRSWRDFVSLVHVDDRRLIEECRARAAAGESRRRTAFRILPPDNVVRHLETISEGVRDASGSVIRTVGAIQDASDRKRVEQALHDTQERVRLALEATGLGPWEWDLTTDDVNFWPEWKRQLGYEPDEIPNRYEEWESRLHPEDRDRVLGALQAYLAGEDPQYKLEFRLRHKNGSYRWIYTRGVALRDESGRPTFMIGCHLDITDRKWLEDEHRHSQKMQAVGQLAGSIAHDFNNLLVVIGGYAELVADELGPSHSARRDLDEIRAAARIAATLTRQLLAFSRRQILQPQILDLNQVLRRMERLLERAVGEDVALVMELNALGRVTADPGQIEQVMLNLAVNARDAMPHGGRLTIETADAEPAAGRHVRIVVSDTGTGMDEETRAHLFEPFFTTKPADRGTGLGLATVYGIVQQSGGSIEVASEPGRGSTFTIWIPVATAALAAAVPSGESHALRGTESVLILEDQAEVREFVVTTLRRYGYAAAAAANGAAALAVARPGDGPLHVMLTDVVLPGASGREIASQVVRHRPGVRVLYMSGYTEDAIHHYGVLEPGLAFIQKPFTAEELVRRIREVLDAEHPPVV